MKEVLLTLLSLTLSGSLLCVLVLLLRPVTGNRVPRAVSYYLWLAVLLRFLIPLGYGITLPQLPQPTQEMVRQETVLPDRQDQTDTQAAPITPPSEPVTVEQPGITQPSAPAISLPGVLVFLWLAVGAGFFFWHIAAYARFSRRVRTSLAPPTAEALALFEGLDHSRRIRLACSSHVNAPMLLGVFRPVIVLPQGGPSLPPQALAAALRHELTHARRWDICYKGYPSHWRTFWYLKTDGTFTYSYTAGTEDGIASARFGEDGLTLEKHIRCEMEALEPKAFEVDGRPVSQTEYEAACSAQDQKADAVWYELNETNIQQLTA